jgi:iron(III) transport system permease protein
VRICAVALQSMQSGYARITTSFDDSARILGTGDMGLPRPFNSDTLAMVACQLARDERMGEAALPSLALVGAGALVGLIPVVAVSRTLRASSPGLSAAQPRRYLKTMGANR